jgi:hypothetical protein
MTPGPFALDEGADLLPAVRRPIGGWRIAYGPDFGVFPSSRRSPQSSRTPCGPLASPARQGGQPPLGRG